MRKFRMIIAVILMVVIFIENQVPTWATMTFATVDLEPQAQVNETKLQEWAEKAEKAGIEVADTEPEAAQKGFDAEKFRKDAEEFAEDSAANATTDAMVATAEHSIDEIRRMGRGGGGASAILKIFSVITTFIGVGQDVYDLNHLTGEHVITQKLQIAALLADIAVLVASMMSWLAFPWSLLAGLLVSMIVELLMNENVAAKLDEFFNWLEAFVQETLYYTKLPHYINVLKPNIYIYDDTSQRIEVSFMNPHLLTTSIPQYHAGWAVTADTQGQLTDKNGESYGFLFYESKSRPELFQTEEGYRITADRRALQMAAILMEMGFNEQETVDFVDFWTAKLDEDRDYIMYPQDTETIDYAMPVKITPEPASIERIWFYFIVDEGQAVETPDSFVLDRNSAYSVIEWGGMVQ